MGEQAVGTGKKETRSYFALPFSSNQSNCEHEADSDAADQSDVVQSASGDFDVVYLQPQAVRLTMVKEQVSELTIKISCSVSAKPTEYLNRQRQ